MRGSPIGFEGDKVMKHRVMFAMLAVTLGRCAQAPQGPTAEEMVSAANALDQAFIEAFNRGVYVFSESGTFRPSS